MSIRRRKGKKGVRYQVVVEQVIAGERHQSYKTFLRLEDAERFERSQLVDRDREALNLPSKQLAGAYLREWLNSRTNTLRPSTMQGYEGVFRRYVDPAIGHLPLSSLTGRDLDALYSQMRALKAVRGGKNLSESTIDHVHKFLSSALQDAVPTLLRRSPTEAVTNPPRPKRTIMVVARADEIPKLLEAAVGSRYEVGVWLALFTALRRSEICALQWSDLDLVARTLEVRRTVQRIGKETIVEDAHKRPASHRVIGLPETLCAFLREVIPDGPWVLGGRAPVNPDGFTWSFRRIAKKAGVPMPLHAARHTHASILIKAGVPLADVSAHLGHRDPSITARVYSHVFQGHEQQTAQAFEDVAGGQKVGRKTPPQEQCG